jgi:hypothetical protein
MKTISACLSLLAMVLMGGSAAGADWEGVFEGTLGKTRIIVQLDLGPEGASSFKGCCSDGSRYSYLPRNYDLKLAFDKEGDTLEFTEAAVPHYAIAELPKNDPARSGRWSLKVTGDTARGTWTSTDGKKSFPIRLSRLPLADEKEVPRDGHQLAATYNQRWFTEVKISGAQKPVKFGDVTLAFETDSAFGQSMPVFTAHPDKAAMARANGLLRDYYKQSLMQYRDCINGLRREADVPSEPEYNFEVVYASPTLVTISEGGSVFCGGAHPNNYVNYLSFDVITGQQIGGRYQLDLAPEGFGVVLKLANKTERIAFENFALARWQAAAKAAGDADPFCAGPNFLGEQEPGEKEFGLSFSALGLNVFRNDYPSAAANCLFQDFNPTVIPWADLKPWLRSDQKLLTVEMQK